MASKIPAMLVRNAENPQVPVTPVHTEPGNKPKGSIELSRLGQTSAGSFTLPDDASVRVLVSATLENPSIAN